jgi:transglutaminase/protease-like cytokinesis protein 3
VSLSKQLSLVVPDVAGILVNENHLVQRHDNDIVNGMNLKLNNKKTEMKWVAPTGKYFFHIGHKQNFTVLQVLRRQ